MATTRPVGSHAHPSHSSHATAASTVRREEQLEEATCVEPLPVYRPDPSEPSPVHARTAEHPGEQHGAVGVQPSEFPPSWGRTQPPAVDHGPEGAGLRHAEEQRSTEVVVWGWPAPVEVQR